MEGPTADPVGKLSMPIPLPSSSILLITPDPELSATVSRYFPAVVVNTCSSFEDAVTYLSLNRYQIVVCPQRVASRDDYSLLNLNQLHNPYAPFIVTTDQDEVADVQQAIDRGALGFLHGTPTNPNIGLVLEGLMALYRLRLSLAGRWKWATDYREQIRTALTKHDGEELRGTLRDNLVMCEQTLVAIEGSILTFRSHADSLTYEARQRMWET